MDQGPDQTELRYRIALHAIPGVGPRIFLRLLDRFGSAREVFRARASAFRGAGLPAEIGQALNEVDWHAVDRTCAFASRPNCAIVPYGTASYPPLLAAIADPPPILFARGDVAKLSVIQVAIVGSRNATLAGRRHARRFAEELARCGIAVTSGLAYGIDGEAHRGALERGTTIAVLGSGIDRVYPEAHRDLAEAIVAGGGVLVSELPLESRPLAANFPRRNRIISGLSVGVVVVEARARSGSLLTAKHALEQGREVFALPGSIDNPNAEGGNFLIQQGAKLVCRTQDVLDELTAYLAHPIDLSQPNDARLTSSAAPLSPSLLELLQFVTDVPVSMDELMELSGLTVSEVSSMLSQLELAGLIEARPGGLYLRSPADG